MPSTVGLRAKTAQAEGVCEVVHRHGTVPHVCTCMFAFRHVVLALDFTTNALALAQACHKIDLHLTFPSGRGVRGPERGHVKGNTALLWEELSQYSLL